MSKIPAETRILLNTNSLDNLASKTEVNSHLRDLADAIRKDVADLLEEKRQLEQTIKTLIDESDDGVDSI